MVRANQVRGALSRRTLGKRTFATPNLNEYQLLRSRFNRIAWGYVDGSRPQGVIAAGMENGELGIWDPEKILANLE